MGEVQQSGAFEGSAGPQTGRQPAPRGVSMLSWPTRGPRTRVLFWTLLSVASVFAVVIYACIIDLITMRGALYVNHVFLFWGWSKFIHLVSPANLIYVPHVLYAFEHHVPGAPHSHLPFAYPATLLMLIWPLALVPPVTAWALWSGVGLVLYVWACWQRPWGPLSLVLALVAPSTVGAIFGAQTSLMAAALMIGGCRMLVGRRLVLAGVLFGLLAMKPQYGLLVPVALVSARQWRTVLAAVATVMVSALVSAVIFGWAAWTRLPEALVGLSQLVARHPGFDHVSPTITSGLRMLGAGPVVTNAIQLVAAGCVVVAVWLCCRRGFTPLGAAALMVGAFLVTPYALYYDLPMVSYAVLTLVVDRYESRQAFGVGELLVLLLALVMPVLMLGIRLPWGMIVLSLLFVLIVRRIMLVEQRATGAAI